MPEVSIKFRIPKPTALMVDLDAPLRRILEQLEKDHAIPQNAVKLLLSGKVIPLTNADTATPRELGVTEASVVMALKTATPEAVVEHKEEDVLQQSVAKLCDITDRLASRTDGGISNYDHHYFAVTNQDGQEIRLPEKDRQGLIRALALQQQADAKKDSDPRLALELYLRANDALDAIDRKVVEMVDNFAIMYLDICWIIFRQNDLASAPRAVEWLEKARIGLAKAHGENMERVRQIRMGVCPEMILYVRLHLLQGVLAMLRGNNKVAATHLLRANEICLSLTAPDEVVEQLQSSLGISKKEAIRAWRACGDVNEAASYALVRQQKAREMEMIERERRHRDAQQRWYGFTASGKRVDMLLLEELCKMGYKRTIAAEALRQADNSQEETMQNLLDPEKHAMLERELHVRELKRKARQASKAAKEAAAVAAASEEGETVAPPPPAAAVVENQEEKQQRKEKVEQLIALGFSAGQARTALRTSGGDLEQAATLLVTIPDLPIDPADAVDDDNDEPMTEAEGGGEGGGGEGGGVDKEGEARRAAEVAAEAEAAAVAAKEELKEQKRRRRAEGAADGSSGSENEGGFFSDSEDDNDDKGGDRRRRRHRHQKQPEEHLTRDRSIDEFLEEMDTSGDSERHLDSDLSVEREEIAKFLSIVNAL